LSFVELILSKKRNVTLKVQTQNLTVGPYPFPKQFRKISIWARDVTQELEPLRIMQEVPGSIPTTREIFFNLNIIRWNFYL
jgi:hypothetical protein